MNRNVKPCRRVLVLSAGWCALLLYAGACSPLGLGVAALAGSFDRSHHLSLEGGTPGLQLVLQHGGHRAGHHHGFVARTLTLFAQPVGPANADHVIQFGQSDSASRQAQLSAPVPAACAQPDFALAEISVPSPREGFLSAILAHPPPGDGGRLVCLRSTLLRI